MTYSLFNLSLILASGLGKTRQDQARRAVHVHQGQTNSALIRPRSPAIERCPSDSGFLAGRARVGPGSAGRAAKSISHDFLNIILILLYKSLILLQRSRSNHMILIISRNHLRTIKELEKILIY